MSKYKIELIENKKSSFVWRLIETATTNNMGDYSFESDALLVKKHFDNGGGFNGWTPKFILNATGRK